MSEVIAIPGYVGGYETPVKAERRRVKEAVRRINARSGQLYDAASTTNENTKHWQWAQLFSADAALRPEIRKILRNRARYEVANNSYGRGIVQTLANYIVGTGPKLQILTDDPDVNDAIETRFSEWVEETNWWRSLWSLVFAWVQDGEAFSRESTDMSLASPVKMRMVPIEADLITNPNRPPDDPADGIIYDDFGNPMAYMVLRRHPGETSSLILTTEADPVQADFVRHLYRMERPGQSRGVSMLTPALPLFAQLRRYTLAVLAAAETGANLSAVLKTMATADLGDPDGATGSPFETVDIERNSMMVLPENYEMQQFKAEQPMQSYEMFKAEIINEISRCVDMPRNIASMNSAGLNFASGKLDHSTFFKFIGIAQHLVERAVIDVDFRRWFSEARMVPGYLPGFDRTTPPPKHEWTWDGQEMLDPREAGALQTKLASGATTFAREFGRRGDDWEHEHRQAAKELGVTLEEYRALLRRKLFGTPNSDGTDEDMNDDGGSGDE